MSDLTTKAAEIRAGLVAELRREADEMHAAVGGVTLGETFHAANWADKPHRVLYDALGHMRRAADLIEQQAAELDRERRSHQNTRDSRERWQVSTFKEQRRATTAESERDELLREKQRLGAALKPFAQAAADCDVVDDLRIGVVKPADVIWESAPAVSITFGHLAAAQSALENGPAGLADANSKSPDPSSQRTAVLEAGR